MNARKMLARCPSVRSTKLVILAAGVIWGTLFSPASATIYNLPPDIAPGSIGSGDVLNLHDGGVLPSPFVINSGGVFNVYGGSVQSPGSHFFGFAGSEINYFGGDLQTIEYGSRGVFNLYDGEPGDFAFYEGIFNLYGGDAGKNGSIHGTVNLHGGNFQDNFLGPPEGVLNIFGRQFFNDGMEITGLTPGVATVFPDRDVVLSGALEDGSPFSFSLDLADEGSAITPGFVAEGFTVTLTLLVPEPTAASLALVGLLSLSVARRRLAHA